MDTVYFTMNLMDRDPVVLAIENPDPAALVLPRVREDYYRVHDRPLTDSYEWDAEQRSVTLRWYPSGEANTVVQGMIDEVTTFAQLQATFGDELSDANGPVRIEITFSGGDSSLFFVTLDFLGYGALIWQGVRGARVLREKLVFSRERDAVARWRNTGTIDDDLHELVTMHGSTYFDRDFSRRFGVDDRERGELLRHCGYEYRYDADIGQNLWVRDDMMGNWP